MTDNAIDLLLEKMARIAELEALNAANREEIDRLCALLGQADAKLTKPRRPSIVDAFEEAKELIGHYFDDVDPQKLRDGPRNYIKHGDHYQAPCALRDNGATDEPCPDVPKGGDA
jgi:hypothetical protein